MLKLGKSVKEISLILGRDKSSIYREKKRGTVEFLNSDLSKREEYSAYYALNLRNELKHNTGSKLLYTSNKCDILSRIQALLNKKYSPDVISGIMNKSNESTISTQTIYNYITRGLLKYKDYKKRTRKCRQTNYKVAYNNTRGRSIEERPFSLTERIFGNWEMDTVVGKRNSKATLLVLTERVSRFEIIIKLKDRTQKSIIAALDKLER